MQYVYNTSGTCARQIVIDVENNKIENVTFMGGCNGNLKGVGSLVKGMTIEEVVERLEGITCGFKPTSCPDQLAKALKKIIEKEKQ